MRIDSALRKFGVSTLMAAALVMVTADVTYAQRGGGGRGGGRGGGNPGFSGGRGYSGGRSFSQPRGNWGGRSYVAPRGNYGGGRGYYNGGRSYSRGRGFLPGNRGYYSNRFYPRGRSFFYFGAPLGGYVYGGYGAPYCNPYGYRDRWGRWYPDPRCAYDPYYGY